jgi:hypothetical protein
MIRIIALAVLSIALMGATTELKHPACVEGPDQYAAFVRAVMNQDRFAIEFYLQTGCGFMKADMPATVLERGPFWIKIEVQPEGKPSVILYTSPGSVKE